MSTNVNWSWLTEVLPLGSGRRATLGCMAAGSNRTPAPTRDVAGLFAAYLAGKSLAALGEREGVSGE